MILEIHPVSTQMKLPRRRAPFSLISGDMKKTLVERICASDVDEAGVILEPSAHDVYAENAYFFNG